MAPCLFSSQLPLVLFLEGILKLVEVHQEFFRQEWLHEVRLGEPNLLTTCPWSCLFACVVKNTERERLESSTTAWTVKFVITWYRTKDNTIIEPITWGYCRPSELTWTMLIRIRRDYYFKDLIYWLAHAGLQTQNRQCLLNWITSFRVASKTKQNDAIL